VHKGIGKDSKNTMYDESTRKGDNQHDTTNLKKATIFKDQSYMTFLQFMNIDYTLMKLKHISSFASQRSFKSYNFAIDYHLACNITNHSDYNPFTIC
jgi:hypothetical protein